MRIEDMGYDDLGYEGLSNRDKTLIAKKDKFWCHSCDMGLVGIGSKCSYCGKRNGRKRNKK